MRAISKNIFLNTLFCQHLGWAARRDNTKVTLSFSQEFQIEQGKEVHRRARSLFPGAAVIDEIRVDKAVEKTAELIKDKNNVAIIEPAFRVGGLVARADIIKREGDGWHLIEVKSSVNPKAEYIDDMAYTAMVASASGLKINNISLLILSKDYRLGMNDEELFVLIESTDKVMQHVDIFAGLMNDVEGLLDQEEAPERNLTLKCKKCGIFKDCLGSGIENHIFLIPRLSQKKFDKLDAEGIYKIEDVPDGFDLTDNQKKVHYAIKNDTPYIGEGLKSELDNISWPAYYLDFETCITAIPLYPDIAPHTQIPTQYSIHKYDDVGKEVDHFEYIADPAKDCQRDLAENLIKDLNSEGSIIVYSSFENTRIKQLATLYPDLAKKLSEIQGRLVDLEKIIKDNFIHPKFEGSTSIKKTLPALAPEFTYEGMEIADGFTASAYFAYMAQGKFDKDKMDSIIANLLEYCKLDTLGMVKLHERLAENV